MEQIDEEPSHSGKSVTISVFSKHKLPEKGYETVSEGLKAYSTLLGGILWMLVSIDSVNNNFRSSWDLVTRLQQ